MKRSWIPVLVLASVPVPARPQEAGESRVSVPLSQYESMKSAQERASVTVVDTLRLGGSFKGRDLEIAFVGRSSGLLPPIDVLSGTTGIVVYGCDGDGIVSRGDGGAFRLTPLAGRFTVRCRLAARGSDRLEMWSTPSVLWVESSVADGEFVLGTEQDDGRRQFSVVRRVAVAAAGDALKPSATGRYRITLRPDETRFFYTIEVHNPNRSRQFFEVAMVSGEQVQQVDAPVPYDVPSGQHRFDIPPGDTTLKLSGSLAGSSFQPPIQASVQYCLLESHPLLRPEVVGQHKRVSPQEVGIATQYRGAQAFLVEPGKPIVWSVTRLEALRTTSFAVKQVTHNFFVPADGPVLGESTISIDNQGAPHVSVPMSGEATFASLQGEPVLLTKDAEGHLWLPIAQGPQELVVQHRQRYRRFLGFGFARLEIPQLPVPATRGNVVLRYPAEWFPVYESFLSDARPFMPDGGAVVAFLLLAAWTARLLAAFGVPFPRRLGLAAVFTLAGLAWGWALVVLLGALLSASGLVLWPYLRRLKGAAVALGVLAVLGGGLLLILALVIPGLSRGRVATKAYDYEPAPSRAASAPEPQKVDTAALYQGLPARFDMPNGVHVTGFERELLDTETPRAARVVMISRMLLAWLQGLIVLAALLAAWRSRGLLLAGWKARLASAAPPAPSST